MKNQSLSVQYRIPVLMVAFVCLAFGIGGGLLRLGWNFPWQRTSLVSLHGPLMVCGFLGAVITLERAVAIGKRWAYLGPFSVALGGLSLILGLPWVIIAILMTIASIIFGIATAHIFYRQQALFTLTLLLSSISWLLGNILWINGLSISQVAPWWIAFLVLTIAGERLELSRILPPSLISKNIFMLITFIFLIGAVLATLSKNLNVQTLSAALIALALWFFRQDVARHNIKKKGLTRFIAICLMSGYFWLLVGALIGLLSPELILGSTYDAFLHSILVGFVFSMIFGHAPIIFPAISKVKIPYYSTFYIPLIVLHFSLLIRITSDLLHDQYSRSMGGALNAVALLLFVFTMISAIVLGKRPSTHLDD